MDYIYNQIQEDLKKFINPSLLNRITTPPSHIDADFSLPLESKEEAEKTASKIKETDVQYIEKVSVANNFINIHLNKSRVYHDSLNQILELGFGYGASDKNTGKSAFIEYSSPNIAKPIGVGHLRSTIIGEAIARIYEATGFKVWRENYLGDWGTPFGKVLVAYQKWGNPEILESDPLKSLKDLYVRFEKESKENEDLMDQARETFKKLEEGDPETVETWNKFRKISIDEFKKVYSFLGIEFDNFSGESVMASHAKDEVKNCKEKGICTTGDNGSVIVKDLEDLEPFIVQKEDGSTLYITRDLATLRSRVETHRPDTLLYVVGSEQNLYFQQLFSFSKAMGYVEETDLKHIGFGLITVDGSPMSTRRGTLIELDDLLTKANNKTRKIIEEKSPELSSDQKDKVARDVAIGSIVYNDLSHQRSKNISFDWDTMLDFNAGSGPYLQYTYARIQSILRNILNQEEEDFNELLIEKAQGFTFIHKESVEFEVVKKLLLFPDVIISAADKDAPHIICGYLEELALLFNSFYGAVSVKDTKEEDLKISRLVLIFSVAQVIKKGLHILNIKAPEKM